MAQRAQHGIVTPEAVLLEFETAGVGSRVIARVIDTVAQMAGLFVISMVLTSLFSFGAGIPEWLAIAFVVVGLFALAFGYSMAFETLWNGRTPGKAVMGLRVVTTEGAPVRFRHAAIRSILSIADFFVPVGPASAIVAALLSRRTQRLGDLVAGTIVLRERTATSAPSAVTFRVFPGWEPYTASLDVGSVTAEEYGLIRSFLMRVAELEPGARVSLAVRIAGSVATKINHVVPPGVHPEHFLVSVAAAYQRRFESAGPVEPPPPVVAPPAPPAPPLAETVPSAPPSLPTMPSAPPARERPLRAPATPSPFDAGGFAPPG